MGQPIDLVKVSESSYPMCSVCNQTKEVYCRFDDWLLMFCACMSLCNRRARLYYETSS